MPCGTYSPAKPCANVLLATSARYDLHLISLRSLPRTLEEIYTRAVARTAPAHGAVA